MLPGESEGTGYTSKKPQTSQEPQGLERVNVLWKRIRIFDIRRRKGAPTNPFQREVVQKRMSRTPVGKKKRENRDVFR